MRVLGAATGLLALLTAAVALGLTRAVDLALTRAIQVPASYPLDVAANAHTYLGLVPVTVTIALTAAVLLWVRGRRALGIAALFLLATGPIELALKLGLDHPGPPDEFDRAFFYLGPGFSTPSSFPSGHATRITFLCALLAMTVPTPARRSLAAIAVALTLLARVYIGDHWSSDVLGGAALGIACASAGLLAGRRLAQRAASKSSFARRK